MLVAVETDWGTIGALNVEDGKLITDKGEWTDRNEFVANGNVWNVLNPLPPPPPPSSSDPPNESSAAEAMGDSLGRFDVKPTKRMRNKVENKILRETLAGRFLKLPVA